jgi:hypothetical protein
MSPAAAPVQAKLILLRRDGMRPLRFTGRLLAHHSGRSEGAGLWHELALYAAQPSAYAAAIIAQTEATRSCDREAIEANSRPLRCHAALCEGLEPAIRMFETHDPAGDGGAHLIAPLFAAHEPAHGAAWQVIAAQSALQETVHRYRACVAQFLAQIGLMAL